MWKIKTDAISIHLRESLSEVILRHPTHYGYGILISTRDLYAATNVISMIMTHQFLHLLFVYRLIMHIACWGSDAGANGPCPLFTFEVFFFLVYWVQGHFSSILFESNESKCINQSWKSMSCIHYKFWKSRSCIEY